MKKCKKVQKRQLNYSLKVSNRVKTENMTKKTKSNSHFNLALNIIPGLFGLSPSFRFWFDSKNRKNKTRF